MIARLACLVGMRAYRQRPISPGRAAEAELAALLGTPQASRPQLEPGFTAGYRPYPCSADDVYCIVEDWTFF
jgi:hypothetical protein